MFLHLNAELMVSHDAETITASELAPPILSDITQPHCGVALRFAVSDEGLLAGAGVDQIEDMFGTSCMGFNDLACCGCLATVARGNDDVETSFFQTADVEHLT